MCILMSSLVVIFVFLVYSFVQRFVLESEKIMAAAVSLEEEDCQKLERGKGEIDTQRRGIEKNIDRTITLYEIAREISQKYNEQDAFEYFRDKLKQNVVFEECWLIEPQDPKLEGMKDEETYYTFPLISKGKRFAYLVFKGLKKEDREKIGILVHQFALGLRRVHLYEKIEELAITDSLTGLFTRRHFFERFKEELARAQGKKMELSFFMIDVDHFKELNDTYGHLAGDQALRGIGKIIRNNIREIDVAGRYGGEEFCVVLPETNTDGALFAAQRIRAACEKTPIKAYDEIMKLTLSIGVVTFPSDGRNLDELIERADAALYKAKNKGRNCVFVYKSS